MKNKMQFLKFNKSNLQFSAVGKKKKKEIMPSAERIECNC